MKKIEVVQLVELIAKEYPQYKKNNANDEDQLRETAKRYFEKLKDADYEEVKEIYFNYTLTNSYPPKLADLIPRKNPYKSYEETKKYIASLENKKPLSKEELTKWHQKLFDSIGVKK